MILYKLEPVVASMLVAAEYGCRVYCIGFEVGIRPLKDRVTRSTVWTPTGKISVSALACGLLRITFLGICLSGSQ